jgi:cephalosporin-C deacetylase-like acetyl esterase
MNVMKINRKIKFVLLALLALAAIYFSFFTLKDKPLEYNIIVTAYQYEATEPLELTMKEVAPRNYEFTFVSYDGEKVNGRISYPKQKQASYPVMIGLHAMGRSFPRWWKDSLKGRPTVTKVNQLTKLAEQSNHVVIALDARYHGSRKLADNSLRSIMTRLTYLGDKADYENMIRKTVIDYRILLDWIGTQADLDKSQIKVAGYSMGAQMALLLSSLDSRVTSVLAIVPPWLDDKTALVAPKNLVSNLKNTNVWLVTADDDETASLEENNTLFSAIASSDKKIITFEGGHILPDDYPESLTEWFER